MGGTNDNPKARLRRELSARRRDVPPEDLARASSSVCRQIVAMPAFRAARHVVLYAARPDEVDVVLLEVTARRNGAVTYYPRADESGFGFHRATRADLAQGRFGILEPSREAVLLNADEPDIVIVIPGVAFDRQGVRLGSGLGFYDRTLPAVPQARRIGVTLDALLVDRLPVDPWDVRVHLIATETRLLDVDRVGSRAGDPAWSC
jgi:5-formyltetrahydrofolate cyclo-ligase